MKRSFLLPLALLSAWLLAACGARSSLVEPGGADACGFWNTYAGEPDSLHAAYAAAAVLDDGSVVVPMAEAVVLHDGGGVPIDWKRFFVRKLDPDGATAWDVEGDPEGLFFNAAARDADGGIYVAGTARAGASLLGAALPCTGDGACAFVAKLSVAGEPTWVKVWPASAPTVRVGVDHLAVMDDGRITVAGPFDGTVDLGCGPLSGTADGFWANVFVARLSPSGECLWSRAIVGPQVFAGLAHMAVGEAGDVALALALEAAPVGSTLDFGGGPVPSGDDIAYDHPLAVVKYGPDGAYVFAKIATAGFSQGQPRVAVTGVGEVLLSAGFTGVIDLGGGPRGSPESSRQFVTKLGATGEEMWTRDIVGGAPGVGDALALALEPGGTFVLAGQGRSGMEILGEPVTEVMLFAASFDAAGGEPIDVRTFAFTGDAINIGVAAGAAGGLVLVGEYDWVPTPERGAGTAMGPAKAFVARVCR